jgi:hypothetical protein
VKGAFQLDAITMYYMLSDSIFLQTDLVKILNSTDKLIHRFVQSSLIIHCTTLILVFMPLDFQSRNGLSTSGTHIHMKRYYQTNKLLEKIAERTSRKNMFPWGWMSVHALKMQWYSWPCWFYILFIDRDPIHWHIIIIEKASHHFLADQIVRAMVQITSENVSSNQMCENEAAM